MTISTQDCKNFIASISHTIDASDKWKRVRKYKEGNLVLRDFENPEGRKLTVAEKPETSQLFLYQLQGQLNHVEATDILGRKYIGNAATQKEVFAFMAECVAKDHSIVHGELDIVANAISPHSWTVWTSWGHHSNGYDKFLLEDFFADDSNEENLELFYQSESFINQKNITKIYWVGMNDYDTAYRIYVFETKDHHLWLGTNDPD